MKTSRDIVDSKALLHLKKTALNYFLRGTGISFSAARFISEIAGTALKSAQSRAIGV
jgi:nicotinate-nucleotide pyrophosphorylase